MNTSTCTEPVKIIKIVTKCRKYREFNIHCDIFIAVITAAADFIQFIYFQGV